MNKRPKRRPLYYYVLLLKVLLFITKQLNEWLTQHNTPLMGSCRFFLLMMPRCPARNGPYARVRNGIGCVKPLNWAPDFNSTIERKELFVINESLSNECFITIIYWFVFFLVGWPNAKHINVSFVVVGFGSDGVRWGVEFFSLSHFTCILIENA